MTNKTADCQYRIYAVGRPILASPVRPRSLRRIALKRFQPITWRRSLLRVVLRLAMLTGTDGLLSNRTSNPLEGTASLRLDAWLAQARGILGDSSLQAVVVWPDHPVRARIFVHLMNQEMNPVAFAKISLAEKTDRQLDHEEAMLRSLNQKKPRHFRVPNLFESGRFDGYRYLIMEAMPKTIRHIPLRSSVFPELCFKEYAGQISSVDVESLMALPWWKAFQSRLESNHEENAQAFCDEAIRLCTEHGARISRVHGDFSCSNMFRDGSELWILDWEESVPDGPILLDKIGYFMSKSFALRDPVSKVLAQLNRDYLQGDPKQRIDAMLSMVFRYQQGFPDAANYIHSWKNVEISGMNNSFR